MRAFFAIALVLDAGACRATLAPISPQSSTSTAPVAPQSSRPIGPHELLASLERTPCFGWCPVYKVTIFRDGLVEYEGKEYVKIQGRATGHLSAEQLDALDAQFLDSSFLGFDDSYVRSQTSDEPSAYTTYSFEGTLPKTVRHYLARDCPVPPALSDLEHAIDRLVKIEQWIGTDAERDALRQRRRSIHVPR
jgi:hypothetical protein